jgi:hypothetical protein
VTKIVYDILCSAYADYYLRPHLHLVKFLKYQIRSAKWMALSTYCQAYFWFSFTIGFEYNILFKTLWKFIFIGWIFMTPKCGRLSDVKMHMYSCFTKYLYVLNTFLVLKNGYISYGFYVLTNPKFPTIQGNAHCSDVSSPLYMLYCILTFFKEVEFIVIIRRITAASEK